MKKPTDLAGRVALITGAGRGLGREHALLLASHGAKVVVNDIGGSIKGQGREGSVAEAVAQEIRDLGGEAMASTASVTETAEVEQMFSEVEAAWGGVDIVVANAGILRDKTFAKMSLEDFRTVLDVNLMGAVHCAKAAWEGMRERQYGRIVFTTSSSGLYGNFGQSNYGAAKMALVGLMQTLALEGISRNIRVNCLAPAAATRMLDGLFPDDILQALEPSKVSPAVLALVSEDAPTRKIICAGAGGFEQADITLSQGIFTTDTETAAEMIMSQWDQISDQTGQVVPETGQAQIERELNKAMQHRNETV
ncbi:SDR family NAD(P)-dependent oxidoreductase [Pseudophaeobacter leonis]|uniref:SDR family NAD(P)-dependent oxidoreductase n=1 Tax=Pseudophaeobacter leonis TaxID=1144477 RepID=UPI0009F5C133|nr:SDR family NAD(P)-dependent oxidoreductase [Pseudophaeobacter leonis]